MLVCLLVTGILGATLQAKASNRLSAQAQTPGKIRNFTLYVRSAMLTMADGKQIFAFGYTDQRNGPAKIPSPTLIVDEGDTVNITLINNLDPTKTKYNPVGDGHTIHLHGLDLPSQ